MRLFFWCAAGLLGLASLRVEAQSWQTQNFFNELRSKAPFYGFRFWTEGLASVGRIRFSSDGTDRFHPFTNTMVLAEDFSDNGGRLKSWSRLGPLNLGTLAHESFHSFYTNHLKKEPRYRAQWNWMRSRPAQLYKDLPEAKAIIALEEAYASSLGDLISSRVTIARMLELRANEEDRCVSSIELAERLWKIAWDQDVMGYYSRDGIGEYWVDRMKELWAGIRGRDSGLPVDGTYFVETPLAEIDRRWISQNLLEGRIQRAYQVTFKKELESLPCYEAYENGRVAEALADRRY